MKNWKLIGIKEHKFREGRRTIPESICDSKKCKFYGKPAAQGVCYSTIETLDSKYIRKVLRSGEELLAEMKGARGKETDKQWITHLENHVICQWANTQFSTAELIYLRSQVAKLQLQLGKYKGSLV